MSQLLTADYVQRPKPGTTAAVAAATRISRQQQPQQRPSLSTRSSSEFVSSNSELESVDSETSSLVGQHSHQEGGDHVLDHSIAKDDGGESDAVKMAKEALEARKLIAKLGTVEDLWLNAEEVRFGSDGDVSDVSEVWSEYGEKVEQQVRPRLHKWNPLRKHLSDRISLKDQDHGDKSKKKKKSKRKKPTERDSASKSHLSSSGTKKSSHHGMSFVPIGSDQNPPQGVYFLDFSTHFKRSLRLAKEHADREARGQTTAEPTKTRRKGSRSGSGGRRGSSGGTSSRGASRPGSGHQRDQGGAFVLAPAPKSLGHKEPPPTVIPSSEDPQAGDNGNQNWSPTPATPGTALGFPPVPSPLRSPVSPSSPSSIFGALGFGTKENQAEGGGVSPLMPGRQLSAKEEKEAKEGGLGPKWPKGMWDNMDSHWRMIMAPCDFVVTPDCYNRLFSQEFRDSEHRQKVDFGQLDRTRRKVRKWMAENSQHFPM